MTKAMKKIGYMIVKIGKRGITVCLFNESEEDLKWACDACAFKGVEIVPCFEDEHGNKYISKEDRMLNV